MSVVEVGSVVVVESGAVVGVDVELDGVVSSVVVDDSEVGVVVEVVVGIGVEVVLERRLGAVWGAVEGVV